jgi:uncharacterized protein YggE
MLAAFSPSPVEARQQYDDRHRINVTGEAVVNVAPDRVIITFGIDTRNLQLAPAKQENDAIAKRALAAMKESGIPDRDIQTDRLSIEQRFESSGRGGQVFAGYTVRNMFMVTLSDPSKVEPVISKALDAGVNYLLGVEFQTTELKKYREQARDLAMRAAREKAEKMASTVGESVGKAIQISEDQRYVTPTYYSSWSGSNWGSSNNASRGMSQNSLSVSSGEAMDTVALGKIGIRASVSVTFELRQ